MTTIQDIEALTRDLAEAIEHYRTRRSETERNRDLSREAREATIQTLRKDLLTRTHDTVADVEPGLAELEREAESQLRALALDADTRAALGQVTFALQTTHPTDLVEAYTRDQDGTALLALRQLMPSIGSNYADDPSAAQTFSDSLRDRIDHHLARVGTGAAGQVARQKALIRTAADQYRSTANYAVTPTAEGSLAAALGEAAARAAGEELANAQ